MKNYSIILFMILISCNLENGISLQSEELDQLEVRNFQINSIKDFIQGEIFNNTAHDLSEIHLELRVFKTGKSDELSKIYHALQEKYTMPPFWEMYNKLQSPDSVKKLYDLLNGVYEVNSITDLKRIINLSKPKSSSLVMKRDISIPILIAAGFSNNFRVEVPFSVTTNEFLVETTITSAKIKR